MDAARCQTRAVATWRSPAHRLAWLSCVRRPGRSSSVCTRTGDARHRAEEVHADPGHPQFRPPEGLVQAVGQQRGGRPAECAPSSQGLVVASVGSNWSAPSGR